jgi:predicted amidohydrolase YtcJ
MTDTRELTIGNADLYLGHGVWRQGSLRCVDGVIVEVSPERFPRGGGRHVDARGASVLPGFQDAHVHPEHGGSGLLGIDLTAVHDADRYLDLVRAYARSHPAEAVLTGNGWYGDLFPGGMPTAAFLDRAEAERPVLLNGHDGHSLWANSAALAAASITADTPDPADGRVLRDADGTPTGVLLDGAMQLVAGLRPEKTRRTLTDGLLAAQAFLHSLGVTAWADAMVGDSELSADPFEAYLELERAGCSPVTSCSGSGGNAERASSRSSASSSVARRCETCRI